MSMPNPRPNPKLTLAHPVSLGVYTDYAQAQKTVDTLSDRGFPVENCMIVGTDLKQVERVTGRLTTGKVIGAGMLSGAWIGLLVGLLMSLFDDGGWPNVLPSVLIGAGFGVVWAWMGYAFTRGQRDFTSVSQVVATRYEVLVEFAHLERARDTLAGRADDTAATPGTPAMHGTSSSSSPAAPGAGAPASTGGGATAHTGGVAHLPPPTGEPHDLPAPDGVDPRPAPKFRTYGEAMDAQRRAEEDGTAEPPAPAYPHTPESREKVTPPPNPRD